MRNDLDACSEHNKTKSLIIAYNPKIIAYYYNIGWIPEKIRTMCKKQLSIKINLKYYNPICNLCEVYTNRAIRVSHCFQHGSERRRRLSCQIQPRYLYTISLFASSVCLKNRLDRDQ